jgi:hypothetical protein
VQVQHAAQRLSELGIQIIVVTFQAGHFVQAYAEETGLRWPLLVDEQRQLYHAYGMRKAKLWDLVGPAVWWAYLLELLRGQLPKWPRADTQQQGGDVLIDPAGIVRFHHVGTGPADRPSVKDLLYVRHGFP